MFPFFERWLFLKSNKFLIHNSLQFSKKISKYSLFFFPLWFISSCNSQFYPLVEKMDVMHVGVDVYFSKTLLKNTFNSIIVKKKMILSFFNLIFFGRSFFVLAEGTEMALGASNLEMLSAFKFNYFLYNR